MLLNEFFHGMKMLK